MGRDEDRQRGAVSAESGGGFDFAGAFADLMVGIGKMAPPRDNRGLPLPTVPWESCHPVWQTGAITLSTGAGTLNSADLYGPKDPYYWDLRTVSLWGFSAGTVTVYLNDTNGEQVGVASTTGQFTWSSQMILTPRDHLVFGATGITGNVYLIVRAIEVETAWLPAYLM